LLLKRSWGCDVRIAVFALFYGDHLELHDRLMRGLEGSLKSPDIKLTVWLNSVSDRCADRISKGVAQLNGDIAYRGDNVPKYEAMRTMFQPLKATSSTDWVVWFDDDTVIEKPDWVSVTSNYILANPSVVYLGERWFIHWVAGQWEFIQKATWFRGKPPELIRGKPGINFAQGAYWWLKSSAMCDLDWPDPRLSHNGGDTLLGEAIRQQGWPFSMFSYGVKPNKAPRRGMSQRPAGSK